MANQKNAIGFNIGIGWCDYTANLWWGCVAVHEGCDNCYAETLSKRWGNDVWGNDKSRKLINSFWKDLNKYQKLAEKANEIHRVFVGSMMDIFEKSMPLIDSNGETIFCTHEYINEANTPSNPLMTGQVRDRLFFNISRGDYPNLMFLFLTKRPSNINKMIPEEWKSNPPSNVMFGTSPVNQPTADTLIPQLLKVNGKRFLSIEPQLGEIYLQKYISNQGRELGTLIDLHTGIDWIIQGGESGHHKRPFNLDWAYSMKKQCETFGIPYFFKQIDKVKEIPADLQIRQFPNSN